MCVVLMFAAGGPLGCGADGDGDGQGAAPGIDAAVDSEADAGLDATAEAAGEAAAPDATAQDGAQDVAPATLGLISVEDLHTALSAKDFLLINVHIPYQGEIAGTDAKISYLEPDAIAQYVGNDPDTKVVVYCMTNYMSTIAGQDLVDRGYRQVRYLDGGMAGWTAAGYPLESNP